MGSLEGNALALASLGLLNVHISTTDFCNLLLRGEVYGFETRSCPRGPTSGLVPFASATSEDFGIPSSPLGSL